MVENCLVLQCQSVEGPGNGFVRTYTHCNVSNDPTSAKGVTTAKDALQAGRLAALLVQTLDLTSSVFVGAIWCQTRF